MCSCDTKSYHACGCPTTAAIDSYKLFDVQDLLCNKHVWPVWIVLNLHSYSKQSLGVTHDHCSSVLWQTGQLLLDKHIY